jgi:CO/xanthine dehydrogenase FAD-binding subunit
VLGQFEYVRPRSVDEACRLLSDQGAGAEVLAGGTDLLVDVRNGVRSPSLLVDVKRIGELQSVDVRPAHGEVVLGAAVPLNVIAENRDLRETYPGLCDAALSIATYQLRNRATVAGNLCHASPAADMAPILLVLGALLTVRNAKETRAVPLAKLFTGVKRTSLSPADLVVDVRIPPLDGELRTTFAKQQRIRGHDLAVVNAAAAYAPYRGVLRVAIGSCAPTPVLLDPIDTTGVSRSALADEMAQRAAGATAPIDDVRASSAYRRAVLPVLLRRLLADVMDEKGGG